MKSLFLLALTTVLAGDLPDLKTVGPIDLKRYTGRWYEIASFPQRFQKGCVASVANYELREDGDINVINECRDQTLDGELRVARGKAWVSDDQDNSKLRVRFFWPFSGKYWVIDLGKNYDYAVVGHPDRDYLWILSRDPKLDDAVYNGILERLKAQHYDLSKLVRTPQR